MKKVKMIKLTKIRKERKMSQRELGEKVGMTSDTISYYERGIRNPSITTLIELAKALDCDVRDLV